MNHTVTVLMYHAVGDARGETPGADAHYAVTSRQFDTHLRLAREAGQGVRSVADLLRDPALAARNVGFTFDDGHASNGPAAERIAQHGGTADFFVNPSQVGAPHYLGWADLRRMADAGMSIQSHGQDHRYLDEMTPDEVVAQVVDSKKHIEDHIGRAVTLFAPPGGRVAPNLRQAAERAGYVSVCSSRVGLWHTADGAWDVPRLAVLQGTPDVQFTRWVRQDRWEVTRQRTRYALLTSAKRLLGNQGYERLRGRLLRTDA